MIYVTHDQIEAMTLGSRVAVMNHGRLQQLAEPQTVYRRPANRFVAKFFGSTPINLVNGQLHRTDDGWCFVKDDWKWSFTGSEPMTASESMARTTGLAGVAGFERADGSKKWPQKVTLGFRGEELQVSAIAAADNCIPFAKVRVLALDHWGDATIAHLEPPFEITKHLDSKSDLLDGKLEGHSADDSSDSPEWFAKLPNDTNIATGDSIKLSLAVDRCLWFDGETGKNLLQHK